MPQIRLAHKDDSNKLAESKYVDTTWQEAIQKDWNELTSQIGGETRWPQVSIVRSVDDAIDVVTKCEETTPSIDGVDVLITGSLYLVGGVLEYLENRKPNLWRRG